MIETTSNDNGNQGPRLGEFVIKRLGDDWESWELYHGDDYIMPLDKQQARGVMLRCYDAAALVRGELVSSDGQRTDR